MIFGCCLTRGWLNNPCFDRVCFDQARFGKALSGVLNGFTGRHNQGSSDVTAMDDQRLVLFIFPDRQLESCKLLRHRQDSTRDAQSV